MKKMVTSVAIAAIAFVGLAAKKTPYEDYIRSEGGLILEPNTQKGEIAYVNCQDSAKAEWITESVMYFRKETKFNISEHRGTFNIRDPKVVGNVTLFIINDLKMPTLLVAPENRWATVNVAPLKSNKEPYFRARVLKELSRGFALLCGASESQFPGALTTAIIKTSDLDRYTDHHLPVDLFARFRKYMRSFGVKPGNIETYETACCQGWAPAPTNDIQKAIWDKVHAAPKNPMKIEFDPKKGR